MKYSVAIIGRFNPVTAGEIGYIRKLLENGNRVTVLIETAQGDAVGYEEKAADIYNALGEYDQEELQVKMIPVCDKIFWEQRAVQEAVDMFREL